MEASEMARVLVKAEFYAVPMGNRLMKREQAPCPHFGGGCLGDGCVNWTPIASPPGQQSAQCFLERGEEAVHLAECQRKAAYQERWVRHSIEYAKQHNAPRSHVNAAIHRHIARDWRRMAETAPIRGEVA
jgi:hypothetical protein